MVEALDFKGHIDRDELVSLVQDLVRIPSHTLYPKRECEIADYLIKLCQKEGLECWLQPADGERCNVIAVIRGDGTGKTLMFNGHTDTVPVEGMDAPFDPVIRDGYMYGRGSTDMKGGVGAMLYAMIMLKRMGVQLKGDLYFCGVIDEDAAKSTGSRVVAQEGPITDYAIIGEPTSLYPVIAHKGIDYFQIDFNGRAAHSSRPDTGANAIYAASDYVSVIRQKIIPDFGKLSHKYLGSPTVNVGLISGSARINKAYLLGKSETFAGVVPDQCSVYLDVRWIPCQSVPEIQEQLNAILPEVLERNPGVSANVSYIPLPRPAMEISEDDTLTQTLLRNVAAVSPKTAELTGSQGFMDSGILYGIAGIKSLVFGPGDIALAHSIGEKLKVEELFLAAEIFARTAVEICSTARI